MSISPSRSSFVTGRIWIGASLPSLIVDLRSLEAAAEVDVDRLPFGERVECRMTGLSVSVARLLPAAEGQVRLGAGRSGVDVHDSGLEIAHRPEGGVRVAREDRGAEAV